MKAIGTILIALVLGVATFAGYLYFRHKPKEPVKFFTQLVSLKSSEEEVTEDCEPTADQLLCELREADSALTKAFGKTRANPAIQLTEMNQLVSSLDDSYTQLLNIESDDNSRKEAEQLRLSSYFMAAQMDADKYGPGFADLAQTIIDQDATSAQASQAAILRFCQNYNLRVPLSDGDFSDLKHLAGSLARPPHRIALYSMVADELWRNQQLQSAETVLEDGIKRFQGTPSRSRLVNQLVDQGHRQPPAPKITQAQFDALMKLGQKAKGCRRGRG